jgi:hypothetical protein
MEGRSGSSFRSLRAVSSVTEVPHVAHRVYPLTSMGPSAPSIGVKGVIDASRVGVKGRALVVPRAPMLGPKVRDQGRCDASDTKFQVKDPCKTLLSGP